MATLTIRNIPDEVKQALRIKAAESGRSLEDSLRQLLSDEVQVPSSASRIDAAEIMKRAADLASDPPQDDRYTHFSQKEIFDAISGEYDGL